jgi:hypothetical protein
MEMKKLVKVLDPLTEIKIFTPDSGQEDAEWEGYLLDMPWYYLYYKVARPKGDIEEPIYIYHDSHTDKAIMVINLLPKEDN